MALVGTLADFSLVDLIQLVDLGRKTGTLIVHGQHGALPVEGRLHFNEGKIHGAELGDLPGDEAAYTLFAVTEGRFEFQEQRSLPPRNVHVSNEILIMEGIGRQETWGRIWSKVPAGEMILKLVPNPRSPSPEIHLEADRWRVLTLINGKSSVDQIAERSGLGSFRTRQIVAELIDAGLIEARPGGGAAALTYPDLESLAVAGMGQSARAHLRDAYRRTGLQPEDASIRRESVLEAIKVFEQSTTPLLGPSRARALANQLRSTVQRAK